MDGMLLLLDHVFDYFYTAIFNIFHERDKQTIESCPSATNQISRLHTTAVSAHRDIQFSHASSSFHQKQCLLFTHIAPYAITPETQAH